MGEREHKWREMGLERLWVGDERRKGLAWQESKREKGRKGSVRCKRYKRIGPQRGTLLRQSSLWLTVQWRQKQRLISGGFKGSCQYYKQRKSLNTKAILSLLILTHIWPKINFLYVPKTLSGIVFEKEREEAVVTFLTWLYFLGL